MKLVQGATYRAQLDLPFPRKSWYGVAKQQLEEYGFDDVTVYDSQKCDWAQGVWPGLNRDAEPHERMLHVWRVYGDGTLELIK